MRPVIAVGALLLSFSTVNAATGDRFNCETSNFQSVTQDEKHVNQMIPVFRQRQFVLTILKNSILSVFSSENELHSQEYPIIAVTSLNIIAAKTSGVGVTTVAILLKPHGSNYNATIAVQDSGYVGVWALVCTKAS